MSKNGDWVQWIAYTVVTMGTMLFVSGIGAGMNTPNDELLLAGTTTQINAVSRFENTDEDKSTFTEKILTNMLNFSIEQ
jgi:hypothetical protein